MNPYNKDQDVKVKVASRAVPSIAPIVVVLLVSVVVLLINGAMRGI